MYCVLFQPFTQVADKSYTKCANCKATVLSHNTISNEGTMVRLQMWFSKAVEIAILSTKVRPYGFVWNASILNQVVAKHGYNQWDVWQKKCIVNVFVLPTKIRL